MVENVCQGHLLQGASQVHLSLAVSGLSLLKVVTIQFLTNELFTSLRGSDTYLIQLESLGQS